MSLQTLLLQQRTGNPGDGKRENGEKRVDDVAGGIGFRREFVEGKTCSTEVGERSAGFVVVFELLRHGADNGAKVLVAFVGGVAEARDD